MPAPLNIILIDDHPLLRMGVAGYIQQEPDMKLTAQMANAAELRDWMAAGNRADAALLDRSLPDADGLDLVSELRDLGIKVIMLTIADTDEEISEAISSGVDGYVIKSSEPDQVLAALRSVCDGQSSFPLNIMQKNGARRAQQQRTGCTDGAGNGNRQSGEGRALQQGHRLPDDPVGKHSAQSPAQHHGKTGFT